MTLEPVTEGRRPVRVTAPSVKAPSTDIAPPSREPHAVPDPRTAEAERALIRRRTQLGLRIAGGILKALTVAGIVLIAYLAISQNWVAGATDALVSWYSATIAPHFAFDPVATKLPVGNGTLFMDAPRPSFVLPD